MIDRITNIILRRLALVLFLTIIVAPYLVLDTVGLLLVKLTRAVIDTVVESIENVKQFIEATKDVW